MERPRLFLDTKQTDSLAYVDAVVAQISGDAKGLSYFVLSVDPDPNALYQIIVAKLMSKNDLEITAIWSLELPHLTSGVYLGFNAGDSIVIKHKTTQSGVTVKSGIGLAFNEVVC